MIRAALKFVPFVVVPFLVAGGCDAQPHNEADEPIAAPSPWRDGLTVAVPEGELDDELAEAMARARETAEDARAEWARTAESLRPRWAVKWAAPTAEGDVEYLWVQPLHWSPFRIEGLLASEPVSELVLNERRVSDGPAGLGDLVAFPIEELVDWVHYVEGDPKGPREGGFTVDVLEARYGRPR